MAAIGPDDPVPASTVVAIRLRELRELRHLNGRQFAARCAARGADRITSHVVTNIETGRREVTVDDLLLFALVLDVPPAELLTPSQERPLTVAVADDVAVADRAELSGWICGRHPVEAADQEQYRSYVATHMPPGINANALAVGSLEWQAAAGRLLGQFGRELDDVTDRLRGQFADALDEVTAGLRRGATEEEVAQIVAQARQGLQSRRKSAQT